MLPKRAADYRTVLWALMMPVVVMAQYANPRLVPWLFPVSMYFAVAAGTIAHNHNHVPTFSGRRMNAFFSAWISIFYGYPAFAWVPTHNLNHHRHVNRPGDATITWRYTNKNTWWMAVTYFFVSAYWQSFVIRDYIQKAKESRPAVYRDIVMQYVVWIATLVSMFALAISLYGWRVGFLVFASSLGLPTLFGPWTLMLFNFMQHVHTDPWSKRNHSRNITGLLFNFFVFNNGYHTVHHDHAAIHWSEAPSAHARIASEIDPRLSERSFFWWVFRAYVLSMLVPSLGTEQIGRAPFEPPPDRRAFTVNVDGTTGSETPDASIALA